MAKAMVKTSVFRLGWIKTREDVENTSKLLSDLKNGRAKIIKND